MFVFLNKIEGMQITAYASFRQHLKSFLDKVFTDHSPLYVTRANGEDVVVLSKVGGPEESIYNIV